MRENAPQCDFQFLLQPTYPILEALNIISRLTTATREYLFESLAISRAEHEIYHGVNDVKCSVKEQHVTNNLRKTHRSSTSENVPIVVATLLVR